MKRLPYLLFGFLPSPVSCGTDTMTSSVENISRGVGTGAFPPRAKIMGITDYIDTTKSISCSHDDFDRLKKAETQGTHWFGSEQICESIGNPPCSCNCYAPCVPARIDDLRRSGD